MYLNVQVIQEADKMTLSRVGSERQRGPAKLNDTDDYHVVRSVRPEKC